MTVLLTLPPEVEARVVQEAAKRSLAVEDYIASVITAAVPSAEEAERRARALAAIEAVLEMGTAEEQHDTFEYLAHAVNEDCLSDRKRFL